LSISPLGARGSRHATASMRSRILSTALVLQPRRPLPASLNVLKGLRASRDHGDVPITGEVIAVEQLAHLQFDELQDPPRSSTMSVLLRNTTRAGTPRRCLGSAGCAPWTWAIGPSVEATDAKCPARPIWGGAGDHVLSRSRRDRASPRGRSDGPRFSYSKRGAVLMVIPRLSPPGGAVMSS